MEKMEGFDTSIYTKIMFMADYMVTGLGFFALWSGQLIMGAFLVLASFPIFRQAFKCLTADVNKYLTESKPCDDC